MKQQVPFESNLQELLKAEREVNEKVQAAQERKNKLLASVKDSAEAELKVFEAEQKKLYEAAYKILAERIEAEANSKKKNVVPSELIERDYEENKEQVVAQLVKHVLTVDLEIPKVVRGVTAEDEKRQWKGEGQLVFLS